MLGALIPTASQSHTVIDGEKNQKVTIQSAQAPSTQPRLVGLNRRSLLLGATLGSCGCCLPFSPPALASNASPPPMEYTYTTSDPEIWKGVCKSGKLQSPVDLPSPTSSSSQTTVGELGPIKFQYPRFTQCTCINAGHGTPQVLVPKGAASCTIGENTTLRLLQFHFHTPAEHSLDGKHAPMEIHLVHEDVKTGELVVIAALCETHSEKINPVVAVALQSAPIEPTTTPQPLTKAINLLALLPKARTIGDRNRPYVSYKGSLTTPPCSEGVRWVVLLDPVTVSSIQVLQLQYFAGKESTLGFNARQQQPLGNRKVEYSL